MELELEELQEGGGRRKEEDEGEDGVECMIRVRRTSHRRRGGNHANHFWKYNHCQGLYDAAQPHHPWYVDAMHFNDSGLVSRLEKAWSFPVRPV